MLDVEGREVYYGVKGIGDQCGDASKAPTALYLGVTPSASVDNFISNDLFISK
jgi:hypothetical protein